MMSILKPSKCFQFGSIYATTPVTLKAYQHWNSIFSLPGSPMSPFSPLRPRRPLEN